MKWRRSLRGSVALRVSTNQGMKAPPRSLACLTTQHTRAPSGMNTRMGKERGCRNQTCDRHGTPTPARAVSDFRALSLCKTPCKKTVQRRGDCGLLAAGSMEERFLAVSAAMADWRFIVKRIVWPGQRCERCCTEKCFKERAPP